MNFDFASPLVISAQAASHEDMNVGSNPQGSSVFAVPTRTLVELNTAEQNSATFEGFAGQRIFISPQTNGSSITISILAPSGSTIFEWNDVTRSEPSEVLQLVSTGTHSLHVSVDGAASAVVTVLETDEPVGEFVRIGEPVSGLIDSVDDTALFRLNGSADQILNFAPISIDSLVNWRLDYVRPLQFGSLGPVDIFDDEFNDQRTLLPFDGPYDLAVQPLVEASSFPLHFEFLISVAEPLTERIELDARSGGSIFRGETRYFDFTAEANERVYVDVLGPSLFDWVLLDDQGATIANDVDDPDRVLLLEAGDYQLQLTFSGAIEFYDSIDYELTLHRVPEPQTQPIEFNQLQSGAILTPGEVNVYTFSGSANQSLTFDPTAGNSLLFDWRLVGPDQETVFDSRFEIGNNIAANLPTDGPYELFIDGRAAAIGDFQFRIKSELPPTVVPISVGDSVSETFASTGSLLQYDFSLDGNQVGYVDFTTIQSGATEVELIGPDSTAIYTQNSTTAFAADIGPFGIGQPGNYSLRLRTNGLTLPQFSFRLAIPQPIDFGEVINTNIGIAQEADLYTFTGAVGQDVYFDAQSGSRFDFDWTTIAPSGDVLYTQRFFDPGIRRLPEDGTYLIIVAGAENATSNYRFEIVDVPEPTTTSIDYGTVVSTEIEIPGEVDRYTFVGDVGQQVYFDAQAGSRENFTWRANSPSGDELYSQPFFDPGLFTLNESGTYTIEVDGIGSRTEAYRFEVVLVPPAEPISISFRDVVASNISLPGEVDVYRFLAAEGQRVYFDAQSGSRDNFVWQATSPSGHQLFSQSFHDPAIQALPETGIYTVVVDGVGSRTASYRFQLFDLPDPIPQRIELDEVIDGQIDFPGEEDLFTLDVSSNQRIYIDAQQGPGSTLYWELARPTGEIVFAGGYRDRDTLLLNDEGTYSLRMTANGSAVPTYRFEIVDVPMPISQPIALGQVIGGAITIRGEVDLFQFIASAGTTVSLDAQIGSSSDLTWSLQSPNGDTLLSSAFRDQSNLTLPQSGEYTLQVDAESTRTGDYRFQVIPPVADLVASNVVVPERVIGNPGELEVTWAVTNQGVGATSSDSWRDYIVASIDTTLGNNDDVFLTSLLQQNRLAPGETRTRTAAFELPAELTGRFYVFVNADAENSVFELTGEDNNAERSSDTMDVMPVPFADLVVTSVTPAIEAFAGRPLSVSWNVTNRGIGITNTASWIDEVVLATNADGTGRIASSRVLVERVGRLGVDDDYVLSTEVTIPHGLEGELFVVVSSASILGPFEFLSDDNNSRVSAAFPVTLLPHPDLVVTEIQAPEQLIADPAELAVSWTVKNQGVGDSFATSWNDRIIASTDSVVGDGDDRVLATFTRTAALAAGDSYTRTESVLLPAEFTGRFHLFVQTDATGLVFELNDESNNTRESSTLLDVMPIPYADLVPVSLQTSNAAFSGQTLNIEFSIENQGIGLTSRGDWKDEIYLARNPDGSGAVDGTRVRLSRFGQLAVGEHYVRSGAIPIPQGIEGTFFAVLNAAASSRPFEFIFDENNSLVSNPIAITKLPSPDLVVASVGFPRNAIEGSFIDVSWTVQNDGAADAQGPWTDRVYLREAGASTSDLVQIGTFQFGDLLPVGQSYVRTESIKLPKRTIGLFEIFVHTNYQSRLFEDGESANNTARSIGTLTIAKMSRPDLQIQEITIPSTVVAGGTISADFTIVNPSSASTSTPNWVDRVYLSLDSSIDNNDILIDEVDNQSALESGQQYATRTRSVVVPARFRGDVYVIVSTDHKENVDEWPHDSNNVTYQSVFVEPLPFPDLVTSHVVVPSQAVSGSTIEVAYTVTNLGVGKTLSRNWSDSIWLTRDKNRPHPNQGDRLLKTISRTGMLARDAGYDNTVTVTLPPDLESGIWYITAWTDPLGKVLEDHLATNLNPDDSEQLGSNNYSARQLLVIGALPDLVVSDVNVPSEASGGDSITVTWTVENLGNADITQPGWVDRVYLSDHPNPNADGATTMLMGEKKHKVSLVQGDSYTESLAIELSPSAVGQYIVVITDDKVAAGNDFRLPGSLGQFQTPSDRIFPVAEFFESNNSKAVETNITSVPANLVVTDIQVAEQNFSGEATSIRYTVTNTGEHPIWSGTKLWKDYIWLSADPTFVRERASYLGNVVASPERPLNSGESYDVRFETVLPEGTNGNYYVYIHLDTHNELSPLFQPYQARVLRKGWFPASTGTNDQWRAHFQRWAFEDPSDNLARTPIAIDYREADLSVADVFVTPVANSGDSINVQFSVSNQGDRPTRQSVWNDRIFISRDTSLDNKDHQLAKVERRGSLAMDETYTRSVDVRIPDGIEGEFHLLVFTDSAAFTDPRRLSSDIGFELIGVEFEGPGSLEPWDLASKSSRQLARGKIKEYQAEGNNIASSTISVTLTSPPDLQVSSIVSSDRAIVGQDVDVTYTVTNSGGATTLRQNDWRDLVYLSRDEYLDLRSDIYLGSLAHATGLNANQSYTKTQTVRLPSNLVGPYYVFVTSDPARNSAEGRVFEGSNERNNALNTARPIVIELPPPSDLQVTSVSVPTNGFAGDEFEFTWTVTNQSEQSISGTWFDSAFISSDAQWQLADSAIGKSSFKGTLSPGESYTSTLASRLPSLAPGPYRVIVRTDIFNQVFEDVNDANNATASAGVVNVTAQELQLDVPFDSTLSTEQERLFQVEVPFDRTLRVTLEADNESSVELYLRHGTAPTSTVFDAASIAGLAPKQFAVVPTTDPGLYYVLVRGFAMPANDTPVQLLAELVPLAITDVNTDVGGDAKFVTTTIEGARFHEDAIVKLVRPGFAEFEPVNYEVISATEIIATFDLEGAPHGLYDLKVINPGNEVAVVPYRFLVEQAIEPDVTIGLGGPRFVFAGDAGTYAVSLQNLGNIDAPYTFFNIAVPEMGIHENLYNLPYVSTFSNLRGAPDGELADLPWAELNSAVNTTGSNVASGYLFDEPADAFTGFTFEVQTYAGLRELHDHAFEQLVAKLYAAFPEHEAAGTLDDGPEGLDDIYPGLYLIWQVFGAIPNFLDIPLIPFQFNVAASATSLTRDEFIDHATEEANRLRDSILADDDASPALVTLAADEQTWTDMYLASFEQNGLLRPEGDVPPIRETPKIVSLMATLASGILAGPAGQEIITSGNLTEFFDQVRVWYGHDSSREVEFDADAPGFTGDSLGAFGLLQNANPTPELPIFEDFDLGLSNPTHFQTFRVYAPWVAFEDRGAGIPAEYQIRGITPDNEQAFFPFNLDAFYEESGQQAGAASMTGPFTLEAGGFVPAAEELPFTVNFQNDPASSNHTHEVRVVTELDPNLDPRSFRLGDIKIGDITVHIPEGRGLFQGDFDFTQALGFVLRISAGVDLKTSSATWLLQAIDPLTGELSTNPNAGLLQPNNAQGQGAGFVSYSIVPADDGETGAEISIASRVLMDNVPPEDTQPLSYLLDAQAPNSQLEVEQVGSGADFVVSWDVTEDANGSGFKHVTLYVAEDGGTFEIWQRQLADASGEEAYIGRVGHTYEFLALATDKAGNQEVPPVGANAQDDGTSVDLGGLPNVGGTTEPNFGQVPEPTADPSTNVLFTQAEALVPSEPAESNPSEFTSVLQPFDARSFATSFVESDASIGPMAIIETPDGQFLVSGGPGRNQLFLFGREGGDSIDHLWAEVDHPIFNLAFTDDGRLWATTGGGPLLELDPTNGTVIASHGDGLTIDMAVEPGTGNIYVTSGNGVEIFNPTTETFTHFSRDLDLRVGSLAFAEDGTLWATTWPARDTVVRFGDRARAEAVLEFDTPIDTLAFGQPGTSLSGLLFVTHNADHQAGSLSTVRAAS